MTSLLLSSSSLTALKKNHNKDHKAYLTCWLTLFTLGNIENNLTEFVLFLYWIKWTQINEGTVSVWDCAAAVRHESIKRFFKHPVIQQRDWLQRKPAGCLFFCWFVIEQNLSGEQGTLVRFGPYRPTEWWEDWCNSGASVLWLWSETFSFSSLLPFCLSLRLQFSVCSYSERAGVSPTAPSTFPLFTAQGPQYLLLHLGSSGAWMVGLGLIGFQGIFCSEEHNRWLGVWESCFVFQVVAVDCCLCLIC